FSGGGRLVLCCWPVLVSVSFATRGQTDMRGLVTAGRWFGWSRVRLSRIERGPSGSDLLIAVSRVAPRAATSTCWGGKAVCEGQSSMTASDQHQPASSRAIAVVATVWRLFRSMKRTHLACRRLLPASPRALAAA